MQSSHSGWTGSWGPVNDAETVHRELVHTLGNLTLTVCNSELSNKPFERKQQIYGDSRLSLSKDLVAHSRWCRSQTRAAASLLGGGRSR